jgi:hypothetical protein
MIWRVGDGCNLNIWKDPWILRDFSRKPITPRDATLITRVSKLIDPVVSGWEYELVNEIFWPEDAELILALPVHEGRESTLAGHFNEHDHIIPYPLLRCILRVPGQLLLCQGPHQVPSCPYSLSNGAIVTCATPDLLFKKSR